MGSRLWICSGSFDPCWGGVRESESATPVSVELDRAMAAMSELEAEALTVRIVLANLIGSVGLDEAEASVRRVREAIEHVEGSLTLIGSLATVGGSDQRAVVALYERGRTIRDRALENAAQVEGGYREFLSDIGVEGESDEGSDMDTAGGTVVLVVATVAVVGLAFLLFRR